VLLETIRPISVQYGFMCLLAYCPWGIFQQYLLNGYIANRLLAVSSARHVPLMAATLFAGAHLPNWFLMAGYFRNRILQHQNLHAVPQYLFPGLGARPDRDRAFCGDPGLDQPSLDGRAGLLLALRVSNTRLTPNLVCVCCRPSSRWRANMDYLTQADILRAPSATRFGWRGNTRSDSWARERR
jgi:hypothetical protein